MNASRRNMLSLTAAGLIHVAATSAETLAGDTVNKDSLSNDLLVRQAAERGHTDIG